MHAKQLSSGSERTWAVIFDAGDEAMSGLSRFAREAGLRSARLQAVGAFATAAVGWYDLEHQEYERTEFDEQMEVLVLVGDVAVEDDEPRVHAHVVLGGRDASAHGGHLLEGYVRPTLEVMVTEASGHLAKRFHPEFGLALIDPAL